MNRTQLDAMLALQADMNAKVNPNWVEARYPFLRANVVEGGEAMEHHGWKWWKKQEMDRAQFQIELVDIWHFTLSHCILEYGPHAADVILDQLNGSYHVDCTYFDGRTYYYAKEDTLRRTELLIGLSVARRVSIPLFKTLMDDAGLTWDGLYKLYVGKNVLNFFRQDNGYKAGTYIKMWNGEEDNVWLDKAMNILDASSPTFKDDLRKMLTTAYSSVCKGRQAA